MDQIRLTQSMVGGKAGTPAPEETEAKGWGNKRGDQPIHLVRRLQSSASLPFVMQRYNKKLPLLHVPGCDVHGWLSP